MRTFLLLAAACFCVYAAEHYIAPMDVINAVIAAVALLRIG